MWAMPDAAPQFRPKGAPDRVTVRRDQDARRRDGKASRGWYALAVWRHPRNGRRAIQLAEEPLCHYCALEGRDTLASIANHNPPHRENWDIFVSGPLESCCKRCHDTIVQAREREDERQALAQAALRGLGQG